MCEDFDIELKKLKNFQMTRLTKLVFFVFINLHTDYSAVRLASVNVIASKKNRSAVKERSKVVEVNCVLRKINSLVFCLSLSGCVDISNIHSIF